MRSNIFVQASKWANRQQTVQYNTVTQRAVRNVEGNVMEKLNWSKNQKTDQVNETLCYVMLCYVQLWAYRNICRAIAITDGAVVAAAIFYIHSTQTVWKNSKPWITKSSSKEERKKNK